MRKLSGKTINSLALCVALAAPLVYLFGSLFMGLAGAHGEQIYGDSLKEEKEITVRNNDFLLNKWPSSERWETQSQTNVISFQFQMETPFTVTYTNQTLQTNSQTWLFWYDDDGTYIGNNVWYNTYSFTVTLNYKKYILAYWNINPTSGAYIGENWETKFTSTTIEENSEKENYSRYIFGQFFTQDNFLAESGREVLNGTPLYGFEPIGELVRYTDENMLHLGNLSYGPLVIGYTYYCAHVIIVDLIFYTGSFIPRLIKKTINKLEGGLD